jgi:hypothetical protein
MARKEIDRVRAQSALEVVREHPVLVLFAASPALALLGAIWWLAGAGWAIFAGVLLVLAAAAFILVRR